MAAEPLVWGQWLVSHGRPTDVGDFVESEGSPTGGAFSTAIAVLMSFKISAMGASHG